MPRRDAYLKSTAAFRECFKLSQTELAELLPVNVRTLQEWESERGRERVPPYLSRALRDLATEIRFAVSHRRAWRPRS